MKVLITTLTDEEVEERDYRDALSIKMNEDTVFTACDGEPEDNNLSRNFSDCYNIEDIIKRSFEAGKNGETLEIEHIQSEDV